MNTYGYRVKYVRKIYNRGSERKRDFIYPPQVTKNVKLCKHLVNGEKCGNVCLASKDKNNKKFYKDYCEEHNHLHIIKGRLQFN